jgi:hypothetical protein
MRIECIHGYFRFYETAPGQISRFMSLFGLEIERSGDHFTFARLVDAPHYSLPGGLFLFAPTTEAFAGMPWDVMRENDLVYDFHLDLVGPIFTSLRRAELEQAGNCYVSTGMIAPGSIMDDGSRVTDYAAFYNEDRATFKYSEVGFD